MFAFEGEPAAAEEGQTDDHAESDEEVAPEGKHEGWEGIGDDEITNERSGGGPKDGGGQRDGEAAGGVVSGGHNGGSVDSFRGIIPSAVTNCVEQSAGGSAIPAARI